MQTSVILTGLFFVVCVAAEALAFVNAPCEGKSWQIMQTSNDTSKAGKINLNNSEIKLGQPFSFEFKICDDESNKPDRVTANAMMPAHQHGMNYTPKVTYDRSKQRYHIEGFVFHMPGRWEITISSYRDDSVIHYTQDVTLN